MESLSPEQAAQVKRMQDLAGQAAGAEGAYAGRMGAALGTYGIRPQTFNPTIQAAEQDAAMANQMAQEAYARRGTLSAQEQRLAQQTAREAAQSAGRLGGNAAIAAEIQNREAALAGRRAQASQAGQQAFDQRQNLANLRFQEQQALFNQGITGATTTADMQQAGLGQLQDIERMRAGLRGTAGEEAMRAYGAAGGFYTTPGLNLLNQTPQSYTAGTNMANIGLNLGQTMTPSLDPNLGLNLALTKSGQMDARSLAQYQMDMQAKAARDKMIGDMIGTGASIFMASDRRLKTDIQRVGTTDGGLPIYTYKYKGESMTQMGVMAQDVEKVNPEAVREFGGYKAVNYALVK
jgi:cytochrome c2